MVFSILTFCNWQQRVPGKDNCYMGIFLQEFHRRLHLRKEDIWNVRDAFCSGCKSVWWKDLHRYNHSGYGCPFLPLQWHQDRCFFKAVTVLGDENQLSNKTYFAVLPADCADRMSSSITSVAFRLDWMRRLPASERPSYALPFSKRLLSLAADSRA